MRQIPRFLKFSSAMVLLLAIALLGLSNQTPSNAQAATPAATSGGPIALCIAPTPTPGGTTPTVEPTTAPVVETPAATTAATPAGKPTATKVPTKVPPTKVPPTATKIPVGKQPANAGIVLVGDSSVQRSNGFSCPKVFSVTAGGPADVAGIQKGDYVLGFDGDELKSLDDFYSHVGLHKSGDQVAVTVQRGSDLKTVNVVLGLNPFAK